MPSLPLSLAGTAHLLLAPGHLGWVGGSHWLRIRQVIHHFPIQDTHDCSLISDLATTHLRVISTVTHPCHSLRHPRSLTSVTDARILLRSQELLASNPSLLLLLLPVTGIGRANGDEGRRRRHQGVNAAAGTSIRRVPLVYHHLHHTLPFHFTIASLSPPAIKRHKICVQHMNEAE